MSAQPGMDFPQLRRQTLVALLPDLILSIIGPIIIYRLASPYMSAPFALLLAGIPPVVRVGIGLLRRRFTPLGILSLLTIALKIFMTLVFQDTRWMLASISLIIGIHGILMLVSLLFSRPLLLWIAESIAANSPTAQDQQPLQRLLQVTSRLFWKAITAILGIALLLECGIDVWLAFTVSVGQFLVISPIVRYSLLGVALIGMLFFARMGRFRKQMASEAASKQLPPEPIHQSVSH